MKRIACTALILLSILSACKKNNDSDTCPLMTGVTVTNTHSGINSSSNFEYDSQNRVSKIISPPFHSAIYTYYTDSTVIEIGSGRYVYYLQRSKMLLEI